MSDTISIKGLDPAAVLAALYNATRPIGMGIVQDMPFGMLIAQAQVILDSRKTDLKTGIWFDCVCGRPIKIQMTDTEIRSAWLYDRDAGEGMCQRVVDALMEEATRPGARP